MPRRITQNSNEGGFFVNEFNKYLPLSCSNPLHSLFGTNDKELINKATNNAEFLIETLTKKSYNETKHSKYSRFPILSFIHYLRRKIETWLLHKRLSSLMKQSPQSAYQYITNLENSLSTIYNNCIKHVKIKNQQDKYDLKHHLLHTYMYHASVVTKLANKHMADNQFIDLITFYKEFVKHISDFMLSEVSTTPPEPEANIKELQPEQEPTETETDVQALQTDNEIRNSMNSISLKLLANGYCIEHMEERSDQSTYKKLTKTPNEIITHYVYTMLKPLCTHIHGFTISGASIATKLEGIGNHLELDSLGDIKEEMVTDASNDDKSELLNNIKLDVTQCGNISNALYMILYQISQLLGPILSITTTIQAGGNNMNLEDGKVVVSMLFSDNEKVTINNLTTKLAELDQGVNQVQDELQTLKSQVSHAHKDSNTTIENNNPTTERLLHLVDGLIGELSTIQDVHLKPTLGYLNK